MAARLISPHVVKREAPSTQGDGVGDVSPVANDAPALQQLCNARLFSELCNMFEHLSKPLTKPAAKLKIVSKYLDLFDKTKHDIFPIIRLILPQLDRKRSAYNLKEVGLGRLFTEVLGLPSAEGLKLRYYKDPEKVAGLNATPGSFSSILYAILQTRLTNPSSPTTVGELNQSLNQLHNATSLYDAAAPITTSLLLFSTCCTATVLLLYYYCTTTVLLLYYYCTTTVLLLYYYCTTTVLLLYYYCTTTVLLLYY
eukprot:Lankesteria_metandrocarpae@DN8450_c0_g1_i1.p1